MGIPQERKQDAQPRDPYVIYRKNQTISMNIVGNDQIRSDVFLKIVMSYATSLGSCPLNFLSVHRDSLISTLEFHCCASMV